jgi:hypothetical protein
MIVQNALEFNKIDRSKSKPASSPLRTSSGEGAGMRFSDILWRLVGQGFQFALLSLDVSGPIRRPASRSPNFRHSLASFMETTTTIKTDRFPSCLPHCTLNVLLTIEYSIHHLFSSIQDISSGLHRVHNNVVSSSPDGSWSCK